MAIREFLSVVMFCQSTLQGRRNLAQRNWESNEAIIQVGNNDACNTKVIKTWQ